MEEVLAVVLGLGGLGAVAASPFVRGLRPIAKKTIAVGLAAVDAAATTAAVASEHWKDLVAEARAEREAAAEAKATAAEAETITIPEPSKA